MLTKIVTRLNKCRIALMALLLTLVSASSFADWQAVAHWTIHVGTTTVARPHTGWGPTKEAAMASARAACAAAQTLNSAKAQCELPPRTPGFAFTEIEPLGGTFSKSCNKCRVEVSGSKLVCDECKPVLKRRELDLTLASCSGAGRKNIENCNGDLACGACPTPPQPKCEGDAKITDQMRKAGCDAICLPSGWKVSCPKKGKQID